MLISQPAESSLMEETSDPLLDVKNWTIAFDRHILSWNCLERSSFEWEELCRSSTDIHLPFSSIRPDCISLRAESPAKCRAGISAITFTYKLHAVKAGCCNQLGSVGIRLYKECRLTLPNESPAGFGHYSGVIRGLVGYQQRLFRSRRPLFRTCKSAVGPAVGLAGNECPLRALFRQ